ncbi:MAG: UDP-N-acetylmuramoyl-L-alanyl-D-glutamate--2,6-diaminopimelate ligase [Clostridia bacterium]|nr:UDP-N-acetylmuramoyl-L-alanyl-D-glutamate--2,6-diaminopimelate ligase [Clostridia bacterium]
MKLSEILLPGEYTSLHSPEDIEIESICYSSEDACRGALFICIRGTRYDSHLLLRTAAQAGIAAAVVEEGAEYTAPSELPIFTVKSTRRALAFAYSRFCSSPADGMHMIAVTGTNGKTSTASMLYAILQQAGKRASLIGTIACKSEEREYRATAFESGRSTMTTPDPDILYPMLAEMKKDGIEYVIMEASSHALALEKIAPITFEIGIFTNLSPEHLDFHATMDNYLLAKARLFSQCKYGILNFDDEYAERIARTATCPILRCGAVYHEEYNAEEIRGEGAKGISYVFSTPQIREQIHMQIPGCFTVYNSLLALTAAVRLGISAKEAAVALSEIEGIAGRLEKVVLPCDKADFSVFVDYAHTEAALKNLLTTVRGFRRGGERIVLLFGCGGDRDKSKRAPMGRVAEELADHVIVTSDNSRTEDPLRIIHDILQGMQDRRKRTVIVNRRRAITYAIENAKPSDIILLVSKGHENYELIGGKRLAFNEKEIVLEALAQKIKKEGTK